MHPSMFLLLAPLSSPLSARFPLKQGYKIGAGEKKKRERRNARGNYFQCIFLISSSDLKSPPACLFHFHVKPCHLPRGGYAGMPHQYKICTLLRSLAASKWVCARWGERDCRGRGGGGGIWEQGGTVLCLLPSAHTEAKLNSNKISHRCALLAQTSVVRSSGGSLVTLN